MLAGPAMADLLPKTATSESARKALNAKTSALPSLKQTVENAGEALSGDVDLQSNVQKVGFPPHDCPPGCTRFPAAAHLPPCMSLARALCRPKHRLVSCGASSLMMCIFRAPPNDVQCHCRLARTSRMLLAVISAVRRRAMCVAAHPSFDHLRLAGFINVC